MARPLTHCAQSVIFRNSYNRPRAKFWSKLHTLQTLCCADEQREHLPCARVANQNLLQWNRSKMEPIKMTNNERTTYPSSSKTYGSSGGAHAADAPKDDLATKGAAA